MRPAPGSIGYAKMSNGTFSLALDSTQIALFLECPEKWHLSWAQHLHKDNNYTKPLDKGSLMHYLLEHYHRNFFYTKNFVTAQKYALDLSRNWMKTETHTLTKEDYQLVTTRFTQYLFYWHKDSLETMSIDGQPAVEMGFSLSLVDNKDFHFVLEGKIDRFAQTKNGMEMFVDYKTQGKKDNINKRRIQFKNYSLACGKSRGMIDIIGLQQDLKEGFLRRELTYFSPLELQRWKNEVITIFYQVANSILSNTFQRNWASCDGKYGYLCNYSELCECVDPQLYVNIRNTKYHIDKEWTPWTPALEQNGVEE